LKPGDQVAVVADGEEYEVVLTEIGPNMVRGQVAQERRSSADPALQVILVQGLPKGDKLELIIQKCTELGIAEIWPVHTVRSVVRLNVQKAEERRERWQRIAMEAAKQCKRQRIPVIKGIQSW
ncbi:MAG TPA: 16S rRNA (uracil(1498)-N(3))-methyltransferase, partial [Firmicutes bacterium]|nr:16S rRNA (uracil(1498)-N(3))-methyltransferase [Bacillota bacterium]